MLPLYILLIDILQVRNTMLFRDIVLLYYSNNALRPYSSVKTGRNPSDCIYRLGRGQS